MKIKMLETQRGSEDGFAMKRFVKGETYEVADTLARMFVRSGWAYEVFTDEAEPLPIESTATFQVLEAMATAIPDFHHIFHPQPTRGSSPQNPKTLQEKGEL